jgi:hypothetical protein
MSALVFQIPIMFSIKLVLIYLTVHQLREDEDFLVALRVRGSLIVKCSMTLQRKRIEVYLSQIGFNWNNQAPDLE